MPNGSADVYFQVQMNVSMTGECDTEQTLFSWVRQTEVPGV